ncbi:hypothetical protein TWF694_001800 [Orbilia ellipsospora]|uniref:Apple domain-containing protein n=1 Tax=Orbilia ellipsospora TaxID=2528407 RepID=A0AAV9X4V1_9PEZI
MRFALYTLLLATAQVTLGSLFHDHAFIACFGDNCARAVTGTGSGLPDMTSRLADCSNFMRTTLLPVPTYASSCPGAANYASACSCWGITATGPETSCITATSTITPVAATQTITIDPPSLTTSVITTFEVISVTTLPSPITITTTIEVTVSTTSVSSIFSAETLTLPTTSTSIVSTIIPGASCTRSIAPGKRLRKRLVEKRIVTVTFPPTGCTVTISTTVPQQTLTVTSTRPSVIIATRTFTLTSPVAGVASTVTITEIDTTVMIIPSSTLLSTTETVTETTFVTQTILPPSLCDTPFTFNGANAFSYSGTVASNDGDGITTLPDCCSTCYTTTNCANYVFNNSANTCTIYVMQSTTTSDQCYNDICPYGHAQGTFGAQPTNLLYGPGPCGGGITRVS